MTHTIRRRGSICQMIFFSQVHLLGKTTSIASTGIHNPSPSLSLHKLKLVSPLALSLFTGGVDTHYRGGAHAAACGGSPSLAGERNGPGACRTHRPPRQARGEVEGACRGHPFHSANEGPREGGDAGFLRIHPRSRHLSRQRSDHGAVSVIAARDTCVSVSLSLARVLLAPFCRPSATPACQHSLSHSSSFSPLSSRVFLQGGAEEAKAFVEELLQWKAEGIMSRVEGEDVKKDTPQ